MCTRVECPTCKRPTYSGCGKHVEQVLGDVAPQDRCTCRAAGNQTSATPRRSWFGGRRAQP